MTIKSCYCYKKGDTQASLPPDRCMLNTTYEWCQFGPKIKPESVTIPGSNNQFTGMTGQSRYLTDAARIQSVKADAGNYTGQMTSEKKEGEMEPGDKKR